MKPDLEQLIGDVRLTGKPGRPPQFTPEVAEARQKEQSRRGSAAQSLAFMALRRLHSKDYRSLYQQAKVKVDAESGPLPGDVS
jgi:hypothetical protein